MEKVKKGKFLVVAPSSADYILSFLQELTSVHKVIFSEPCQNLLDQVTEVMEDTDVNGILTRGSLGQFLYANKIQMPIFELKYQPHTFLTILKECRAAGYKKICILEIGICQPGNEFHTQRADMNLGDFQVHYARIDGRQAAEHELKSRLDSGQVDFVVGDVEPIMVARELGLPCKNFIVDEHAYRSTLEEAQNNTEMTIMQKSQDEFISIITNIISEAVIIADESGKILKCNLQAERLLPNDNYCEDVQTLFGLSMEELLALPPKHLAQVNGKKYVINVIERVMENERIHHAFLLSNTNYVEDLAYSIRRQNQDRGLVAKQSFRDFISRDPISRKLVATAKRYAKSSGTILIHGETGTGKEIIASSIHNESFRASGPFLAINCAALNENLIESELFGYEKGAFTGALSGGKQGMFELAHKGSLFLDEVGELSLSLQAKLLRTIQEKEVMRVGGNRIIPVDVRIIAATNRNLSKMVQEGKFRADLYYRLALLEIDVPALRKRRGDIVPLLTSFLAEAAERENRVLYWEDIDVFSPLLEYSWPGNIRELRNFAERVVLICEDYELDRAFIQSMMRQESIEDAPLQFTTGITNDLKTMERDYIKFLLNSFGGNKDRLCSYLGISRPTLWRKLSNPPAEGSEKNTGN